MNDKSGIRSKAQSKATIVFEDGREVYNSTQNPSSADAELRKIVWQAVFFTAIAAALGVYLWFPR